ncbi:MAG: ATP-binding protein [Deltaproteobacteria bacterium]|nr:ATP-binding protein [Deltaproteobacteria bacterium]
MTQNAAFGYDCALEPLSQHRLDRISPQCPDPSDHFPSAHAVHPLVQKPPPALSGNRRLLAFDASCWARVASPLAGDPDRLRQVFWNLLSNAMKFTSKRGRIQIVSQRINSYIEIIVSDTGIGIEPSEHSLVEQAL